MARLNNRYRLSIWHGEGSTVYYIVDGEEGDMDVESFSTRHYDDAFHRASERCDALNAGEN